MGENWRCPECEAINQGKQCIVCGHENSDYGKRKHCAEQQVLSSVQKTDKEMYVQDKIVIQNSSQKFTSKTKNRLFKRLMFGASILAIVIVMVLGVNVVLHNKDESKVSRSTLNDTSMDSEIDSDNEIEHVNNFSSDNKIDSEKEQETVLTDTVINPYEGLMVEFDGASPYLKASINTSECNEDTQKYVKFHITNDPLKLGDTVIVTAEWDEDCKVDFSPSSKAFKVENTSYYLDSLNGVDLSELNQLMDDYVEAEANKYVNDCVMFGMASHHEPWYNGEAFTIGYNPIVTGIDRVNVSSNYLLSLKQSSELNQDGVYNKYIGIYEIDYSTYREATGEHSNNTAILAVFIDNIVLSADGILMYNSTEKLNSKMFYKEVEDTKAIIESNYIIAEKAQYNVTKIK